MRYGTTDEIARNEFSHTTFIFNYSRLNETLNKLMDEIDDWMTENDLIDNELYKNLKVKIDSRILSLLNEEGRRSLTNVYRWPMKFDPAKQIEFVNYQGYSNYIVEIIYNDGKDEKKEKDNINPDHYKSSTSLECIEAMQIAFGREAVVHFCLCNAWKYIWRWKNKNGKEDLNKAKWYVDKGLNIIQDDETTTALRPYNKKFVEMLLYIIEHLEENE